MFFKYCSPAITVTFLSILFFVYSCKNKEEESITPETGIVTDVDGNVYKTIKIGNQWWMAENLKVKRYNDSTFILQLQSNTDWNDTLAGYCSYANNSSNTLNYGLLYNFYAVGHSKKIAPKGWHIPSDEEWKTLERSLGMSNQEIEKNSWRGTNQGEKMKTVLGSTLGWTKYGDVWNTNESGFSAIAGSCRMFNGVWGDPGLFATGFWWTSTNKNNQVWYRHLDYKTSNVFRFYGSKNYGFSVRCVKD